MTGNRGESPHQPKPRLTRVKRARRRWEAAELEFQAAILEARQQGHTLRAIAEAAGITHPGVLKILRRL